MKEILRPILTNGEEYSEPDKNPKSPPVKDKRLSYSESKAKLIKNIENVEFKINNINKEYVLDNVVINLKMRIDSSSKSAHPNNLIREANFKQVGTRKWSKKVSNKNKKEEIKFGKDIFILTNKQGLEKLKYNLDNDLLGEVAKDNIRSIEELYIDNHETILSAFYEKWEKGRIEVVLHPYHNYENEMLEKFKKIIINNNGDIDSLKIKKYDDGPVFISMIANKELVEKIKPFNPLRAMHPLEFRGLRTGNICELEKEQLILSDNMFTPTATVGIFDGGINGNNKLIKQYVTEYNLTSKDKTEELLNHGTMVTSAALFGDLKEMNSNMLPVPTVKVESFRVLPLEDESDYLDLYEIIDRIEDIVPKKTNIKVFNLSLGPSGPIEDDTITRFTYAIDRLSKDGERIFAIAVGNDGYFGDELGRIQAPADSVNNISVGAYEKKNNKLQKTDYSCIGDGREGAKVKPDVVENGGTIKEQMQFISPLEGKTLSDCGTSFSTPIVARKLAEILEYSSIKYPLTAKAVLIHTSEHPENKPDKYLGYGIVKDNYLEMLECKKNKVTIIYESTLLKAKRVKLPIPFINNLDFNGKVQISWTLCVSTGITVRDTDDYTNMCIEDIFYPNIHKFTMRHPITNKYITLNEIQDYDSMENLKDEGWIKSGTPKSFSNPRTKYATEQERRADFKWDTVVKRITTKMAYNTISEPYIVLHALSRDKEEVDDDRITYSVVITVEYISCNEDVYNKTINKYSKLNKANIININELIIK
ncbi:S8 family peptidase [Clostridium botulinum]|uniref:S8 family peptidase n=1 Tax=Clostridium botulinum TaxID=1491 RepID=UPI0013FF6094|nr:S8 family peptidase [Clostridium botulinum]MBY6916072.1 S8 family peptidase [Clostridium botulinum]NFQ39531.1 S8 family peptidase [Clostridium botulinum]